MKKKSDLNSTNVHEKQDLLSFSYVSVEIRKKMMRIFDSQVAFCEVSILPLLIHPNACVERLFCLKDTGTGAPSGMLLLKLLFRPFIDIPIPIPISIPKKIVEEHSSINSIDADEAETFLGSGGDRYGSNVNLKAEELKYDATSMLSGSGSSRGYNRREHSNSTSDSNSNINSNLNLYLKLNPNVNKSQSNERPNTPQKEQQRLSTQQSKELSKEEKYMQQIQQRIINRKEEKVASPSSAPVDHIPAYSSAFRSASASVVDPFTLQREQINDTAAAAATTTTTLLPNMVSLSSSNSIECSISSCSSGNVSYSNLLSHDRGSKAHGSVYIRAGQPYQSQSDDKNGNDSESTSSSSSNGSTGSGSDSAKGSDSRSGSDSRNESSNGSINESRDGSRNGSNNHSSHQSGELMTNNAESHNTQVQPARNVPTPLLSSIESSPHLLSKCESNSSIPHKSASPSSSSSIFPSSFSSSSVSKQLQSDNGEINFRNIQSDLTDSSTVFHQIISNESVDNDTNSMGIGNGYNRDHKADYQISDYSKGIFLKDSKKEVRREKEGRGGEIEIGEEIEKERVNKAKLKEREERRGKEEEIGINSNIDQFGGLNTLRKRRNSTLSSSAPKSPRSVHSNNRMQSSKAMSVTSGDSNERSSGRFDRRGDGVREEEGVEGRGEGRGKSGIRGVGGKEGGSVRGLSVKEVGIGTGKGVKSSLLTPLTPSGMADWLRGAGQGAVQYLERQLMDSDEKQGDLNLDPNINVNIAHSSTERNKYNQISDIQSQITRVPSNLPRADVAKSERMEGVGRIYVNLVSAFKSLVTDAAEGDHYVVRTMMCDMFYRTLP